ncbi:MAG: hypothetical protein BMS9Abin37_0748 [Acidobacteriota bacterium]|nr:MAG: hypothetical protein BMS9Abin37_0748 [Acidobacteriota bacterium]
MLYAFALAATVIRWEDQGHGGIGDEERSCILAWLRETLKPKD